MTQDDQFTYNVDGGEAVTVTVTAVHCANLTVASFNGGTVNQTPANSGVYTFPVIGTSADTVDVGLKFVCRCTFQEPPAGAVAAAPFYSVNVQGADGKVFTGPTVHISVPEATFALSFFIN
jgi:hypothetical protein